MNFLILDAYSFAKNSTINICKYYTEYEKVSVSLVVIIEQVPSSSYWTPTGWVSPTMYTFAVIIISSIRFFNVTVDKLPVRIS
uniref:Transmembrane protein n=1 Tax=Heterorhabditis bacteriophora TaxID=37862 RepID=A0A1I7WR22_HETBA